MAGQSVVGQSVVVLPIDAKVLITLRALPAEVAVIVAWHGDAEGRRIGPVPADELDTLRKPEATHKTSMHVPCDRPR